MPKPARCSRAIHGMPRSERASPSPICAAAGWTGRAIGGSSLAAMARWKIRRRSPARRRSPTPSAPASIPAPRCAPQLALPANARVEIVFFLGEARQRARRAAADHALSHEGSRRRAVRSRPALGGYPRHGAGEDARSGDGHHAERLAAVSDAGLPHLGALGILSGERCLWLPRPVAGRHGADRGSAGDDARASAAGRGAAVCRRRRAALVAAAFRSGRAHAHLRRSGMARLRRRALCRCQRRCRRARRGGAVPGRPASAARRA